MKLLQSNKYILLFIAILLIGFLSKSKEVYTSIGGIRPGMANSFVPLGRPMWNG